jgi:hypothetical protein
MTATLEHGRVGFDPLAYELVAIIDTRPPEGSSITDALLWENVDAETGPDECWELVDSASDQTACAHCGKPLYRIRYVAYAIVRETGAVLAFGATCADELGYADEFELAKARARKLAETRAAAAALRKTRNEWEMLNPDASHLLDRYEAERGESYFDDDPGADEFVARMVRVRRLYGKLSEKQTRVLDLKPLWIALRAERARVEAERLANVPDLEEGRRELVGTFRSAKWVENDFGGSFKGVLALEDGNAVYGTIPRAIEESGVEVVGTRARFFAAVTVSDDDPHFGFYKRPTKVERLEEER